MTGGDSNGLNMDKSTVYEKAVGKCPVVTVRLDGADVPCLLDSRSEVSTITEEFFKDHFRPLGKTLLPTGDWLRLTAANGLAIPYVGYLELDVEALGVMLRVRRKRNFSCKKSSKSRGQATQEDYPWTNRDEYNCPTARAF